MVKLPKDHHAESVSAPCQHLKIIPFTTNFLKISCDAEVQAVGTFYPSSQM